MNLIEEIYIPASILLDEILVLQPVAVIGESFYLSLECSFLAGCIDLRVFLKYPEPGRAAPVRYSVQLAIEPYF